ncbi:MaoC family dehydratase N-terminal domain-containing protein [Chloroflexota bacterium]
MVDMVTNIDQLDAAYKKWIGKEIELKVNSDASKDNILNYCDAIADSNPLWTDEAYAKKSRLGAITAPPTFYYMINHGTQAATTAGGAIQMENISQMYSGAYFEYFRPIYAGDTFTLKAKILPPRRVETKTRGAIIFATGDISHYNQNGELVAISRPTVAMVPITRESREAPPIRTHDPDKPEWAERRAKRPETLNPDTLAFERKRRGAEPRYWEEVEEGQEMEPLEKGILTATEITRWSLYVAMLGCRLLNAYPGGPPIIGLARAETSQLAHGVADPEDFGPQRTGWLGQAVTDWMGDDATLKKFSCQIRGPNMMGDINTIKGKVVKKYIENGEHLVDCELFCENQGGNVSAPGWATVILPSRG